MPMYLAFDADWNVLGEPIHAECIESADVEAMHLYPGRLHCVQLAPRAIVKPERGRPSKGPSMYAEARMLTGYGVFGLPEWRSAQRNAGSYIGAKR